MPRAVGGQDNHGLGADDHRVLDSFEGVFRKLELEIHTLKPIKSSWFRAP